MIWWLLLSVGVNVVCVWINFRSIRAYYDAHDLLMQLCLSAWRMRDRGESGRSISARSAARGCVTMTVGEAR
jgi:hypothetical protein